MAALPAVYLLVEKRLRRRTWIELGFKIKSTFTDLRKNWYLIGLVGVVSPLLTFFAAKIFLPGYIDHVTSRLPMNVHVIIPALITVLIGTFLEEVIYRGFMQNRLEVYLGPLRAIVISSLLFAFMHFSPGSLTIVSFDILGIFVDSVLYGMIFSRTKNVFASWVGHLISDVVGIICFLL